MPTQQNLHRTRFRPALEGLLRVSMPLVAHIMLALAYLTASVLGGVALYQYSQVPPLTAALIGATASLAMIQLHGMIARMNSADTEKELFDMRQEMRRLTARLSQAEQHSLEL